MSVTKQDIEALLKAREPQQNFIEKHLSLFVTIGLALFAFQSGLFEKDGTQNESIVRLETKVGTLNANIIELNARIAGLEEFSRAPFFTRQDYMSESAGMRQQVERNTDRLDARSKFIDETNDRLIRIEADMRNRED